MAKARADLGESINGLRDRKANGAQPSSVSRSSESNQEEQSANNQSDNQSSDNQSNNSGESNSTDSNSSDKQTDSSNENSGASDNQSSDNQSDTSGEHSGESSGNPNQPTDVIKPKSTRGRKPKVAADGEKVEMTSISIRLPKRVYNELLMLSFREGEKRMELISPSQLAEEAIYKTYKLTK